MLINVCSILQMIELQSGAVSVEDCGFALTVNGDIASGSVEDESDSENVLDDIRLLRENMKEEYKLLKDQQAGLIAALASLNILINGSL